MELAVPWVMGFLLLDTVVKQVRLDELPRVVFLLVAIFLVQKGVVFPIAHRLSMLWNADKIVVIENGTIVQAGRHEELHQSAGIYRRLYRLQQRPGPKSRTAQEK